jgi:predicted amidophosphoribosyltransferase
VNLAKSSGLCKFCLQEIVLVAKHEVRFGINIFSGSNFSPKISRIILAAKEDNNLVAREFLIQSLLLALSFATSQKSKISRKPGEKLTLIPIPSRSSVNRSRGYLHANLLTSGLLKTYTGMRIESAFQILTHKVRIQDQSKLSISERRSNMDGSMIAKRDKAIEGSKILLVDDLVTSGLTLRAAKLALEDGGYEIAGAICAASNMNFGSEAKVQVS